MEQHNDEKYALEYAALNIFLNLFNHNHKEPYELVEKRESPDFVLKSLNGELLGLEVAHLFYDSEEAKMIFGRSNNDMHGIEIYENLIITLNNLLKQKEKKILKYDRTYPTALLIRNASPVFGMSSLLREKGLIYKPNNYKNVWFVSKDEDYNDWLMIDILTL